MAKSSTVWQWNGEWGNHGLDYARTGLIAWSNSRVQGSYTGRRVLIPWAEIDRLGYSQLVPIFLERTRSIDQARELLDKQFNPTNTIGEYLFRCSRPEKCRILRRGTIVQ